MNYMKATIKGLSLSIMPASFFGSLLLGYAGSNINVGSFNKRLTGGFLITDGIKWFNNFDLTNVQCVLRQGSKLSYKAALMFSCLLIYTLMHLIHIGG